MWLPGDLDDEHMLAAGHDIVDIWLSNIAPWGVVGIRLPHQSKHSNPCE
jgi:hypothetical protein